MKQAILVLSFLVLSTGALAQQQENCRVRVTGNAPISTPAVNDLFTGTNSGYTAVSNTPAAYNLTLDQSVTVVPSTQDDGNNRYTVRSSSNYSFTTSGSKKPLLDEGTPVQRQKQAAATYETQQEAQDAANNASNSNANSAAEFVKSVPPCADQHTEHFTR